MKQMKIFLLLLFLITSSTHVQATETRDLTLSSSSAILIDATTNTVLFEKASDEKMYPASLTKIATAIYAIEHAQLDEIVTVSDKARRAAGTRVYLEAGEKMPMKQLIEGLLVNSGNDAAIAIAEHIAGTEEQFAKDVTNYLKEKAGIRHTNFTNSSGLYDENHYSTARDLASITKYAMQNAYFMEVFNMIYLPWKGESWDTTIVSHHRMVKGEMSFEGITGGKTGFVPESRFTLATTAKRNDIHLVAIVLNGEKRTVYTDTKKLFEYGFTEFEQISIEAGTQYEFNEIQYELPSTITYTKHINLPAIARVTATGMLNIMNHDGTIIHATPLKNLSEQNFQSAAMTEKQKLANAPKQNANEVEESQFPIWVLLLFTILILIFIRILNKNSR